MTVLCDGCDCSQVTVVLVFVCTGGQARFEPTAVVAATTVMLGSVLVLRCTVITAMSTPRNRRPTFFGLSSRQGES